jgi:uncharacterized cupin superfamily protein
MIDFGTNVWTDDWGPRTERDEVAEKAGFGGVRARHMYRPPDAVLGATVWEVDAGATQVPYHFHHGAEELLIVLRGQPTLRTPDGERQLVEGDVVHFPRGPEGAHQVINRSDSPVRFAMASVLTSPEVVEYPDSGKVGVMARTHSQAGGRLVSLHRLKDAVSYFDGESPR